METTTDHSMDINKLRNSGPWSLDAELAADLLEAHDATGIDLNNWPNARRFVQKQTGHSIDEKES